MTIHTFQFETGGRQRDARLTLATGLLRAVVSQVSQPSIFEVDCAAGKAEVRSTDWFIEAQPGSARVGVLAGSVVLMSLATGRSITIPARWGARLEAGLDPVAARLWSAKEFADVIARTEVR
jgi:ferric-dicitrate binding protein FerR (iron transport regulator)